MKILVRMPNWIGDSVLALPAMKTIKRNYPESEVWAGTQEWVKDLFAMDDMFAGAISLLEHKSLKNLQESAKILRKSRFDLGILFTNSFASALVFAMARIPQRWGYKKDGRGLLLTKGIPIQSRENRAHQVHYYLDLLLGLGLKEFPEEHSLPIDRQEKTRAEEWLGSQNIQIQRPLIIISPGAYYGSAKRWPAKKYAELATLLQSRMRAQVLVIGSADETPLAEAISSLMSERPHILTGNTSLPRLAALLSLADLLVTNDSGPMHLANILKVPLVALFGPTEPARTGPYQQPAMVIHKGAPCWPCSYRQCPFDHRCMMDISPEEVFQACQKLL
ncbi:MAG: lipopolysaccharide heptosyltransferase II [Candidatus Aminicenantes bacterium]|nr:MAG: lipopolysaccharide heptosyltransferase II [Candidatus Aminicenantes bacterium]